MGNSSKTQKTGLIDKMANKIAATRFMRKLVANKDTVKSIISFALSAYFLAIAFLGFAFSKNTNSFTAFMVLLTNLLAGILLLVTAIMQLLEKDVSNILFLNITVLLISIFILNILESVVQTNIIAIFLYYISPLFMLLYYLCVVAYSKLPLTTTMVTAPVIPTAFASVSILTKGTATSGFTILIILVALTAAIGLTYLLLQINNLFYTVRMRFYDTYISYIDEEGGQEDGHVNPWELLDYEAMKNLGNTLKTYVVGQEEAISRVEKIILKAYMGIAGMHMASSKGTPRGIMFFVGPTGVGKTELCKAIAKFVFDDDSAIIRFDMSEYAQENSDQKLIGAPPGFVGFKEGGLLTNAIKKKPFSIVLFDEIEKAAKPNPRILDLFLQILEDGRLTDSKGETVYFNESIIIFTSNLGAADIDPNGSDEEVRNGFVKLVKEYFQKEIKRPEILGRIGDSNIIPFNFIRDKSIIERIVLSKLKHIQTAINKRYNINLLFEDEMGFIQFVFGHELTITSGRTVLNKINDALLDTLAVWMFNNKPELDKYKGLNVGILASVATGTLTFEFMMLTQEIDENTENIEEYDDETTFATPHTSKHFFEGGSNDKVNEQEAAIDINEQSDDDLFGDGQIDNVEEIIENINKTKKENTEKDESEEDDDDFFF